MTDSNRRTFETKGYLTIENVLSSDELHALNAALDREFSDRRDTFYSRSEQTYQSVRILKVETARLTRSSCIRPTLTYLIRSWIGI